MQLLNDLVPRMRTSTEIDRRTRKIYNDRNGPFAGTYVAEEDTIPALPLTTRHNKFNKKQFRWLTPIFKQYNPN